MESIFSSLKIERIGKKVYRSRAETKADVFDYIESFYKPILAFAGGVHSCIGAHLARLEVKVALQEWLRRIPDFAVRSDAEISYWPGGVVGPRLVPLFW